MTNLVSPERRGNGASVLGRPFADLWSADPFRGFLSNMGAVSGIEVTRTENGYSVEIPVPGYKPDQIDVTFEDGVLTVTGKSEKRSFTRSLAVPEEVDEDKIEARVEHGMLTLTLALVPKAQPKKISVRTA